MSACFRTLRREGCRTVQGPELMLLSSVSCSYLRNHVIITDETLHFIREQSYHKNIIVGTLPLPSRRPRGEGVPMIIFEDFDWSFKIKCDILLYSIASTPSFGNKIFKSIFCGPHPPGILTAPCLSAAYKPPDTSRWSCQ